MFKTRLGLATFCLYLYMSPRYETTLTKPGPYYVCGYELIYFQSLQISDEEVGFLTGGDSNNDEVVMSLWHSKLKLLLVTDGPKGCRYYTKVGYHK